MLPKMTRKYNSNSRFNFGFVYVIVSQFRFDYFNLQGVSTERANPFTYGFTQTRHTLPHRTDLVRSFWAAHQRGRDRTSRLQTRTKKTTNPFKSFSPRTWQIWWPQPLKRIALHTPNARSKYIHTITTERWNTMSWPIGYVINPHIKIINNRKPCIWNINIGSADGYRKSKAMQKSLRKYRPHALPQQMLEIQCLGARSFGREVVVRRNGVHREMKRA